MADLLAVPAADHLLLRAPADIDSTVLCTLPDNVVDAYRTVGPHLAERRGAEVLVDVEGLACTLRWTDDYGVCTSVAIYFTPATPVPLLDM